MHTDLGTRRRVLIVMYQRYLGADRNWNLAQREMRTWFPTEDGPNPLRMGNPGSPIRRLYEQREQAMFQSKAAHVKLYKAWQHLDKKCPGPNTPPFPSLTYTGTIVRVG